ncbi:LysR family transcriptional regulator [Actinoalloteichus hymeniacidonis]|uniref:Transcriptional regulator n=1 Tax=Actinoalloteichus hymeniacidonis TaxID=340345 RepID=A0AAC9MZR6_9PSEU|nr:LysR family transcriptional regulator [Actinoalloteichus hymeniacidonis]AOS64724.1 transcriptional regulator [Actinoalloteichus hymeniacidonis]MBB5907200.1 DNA-binding transcriptional LysR family regulator [Actinoalloteichus hymeniacidonis]
MAAPFTLEQLRGFVAVAEEAHFGRAAARLQMTQPPLSRQVQKLERSLGVDLLVRTTRAVLPTPAGEAFLTEARRILNLADAAPSAAQHAADGATGSLHIGFTAVTALTVLGSWIKVANTRLPAVRLTLTEMVTRDQVEALLAGELSVGLVRGVAATDVLSVRRVHAESLVLACPGGHPLTTLGRPPTLADVAEHAVITYSPVEARYLHELVITVFRNAGVEPRYVQRIGQVQSLLALVDAGLGVALVPRSSSRLRLPNLAFTEIAGLAPDLVEAQCAWRSDHDDPALAALLRLTAL